MVDKSRISKSRSQLGDDIKTMSYDLLQSTKITKAEIMYDILKFLFKNSFILIYVATLIFLSGSISHLELVEVLTTANESGHHDYQWKNEFQENNSLVLGYLDFLKHTSSRLKIPQS